MGDYSKLADKDELSGYLSSFVEAVSRAGKMISIIFYKDKTVEHKGKVC